jgi:hypothetical protein
MHVYQKKNFTINSDKNISKLKEILVKILENIVARLNFSEISEGREPPLVTALIQNKIKFNSSQLKAHLTFVTPSSENPCDGSD